jgi:hypothetical protein
MGRECAYPMPIENHLFGMEKRLTGICHDDEDDLYAGVAHS